MFPFDPPETIRKPMFSGGSKGNIGKKRVKKNMNRRFAPSFLAHFKNQFFFALFSQQTRRRTGDKVGFIVQHKINQKFEYSNNDGEKFKQFSPYLAYRGENKVLPSSMGSKNALVKLEHS